MKTCLDHIDKGCVFRPVYCPHLGICKEKVIVFKNIISHLEQQHYNDNTFSLDVVDHKFIQKKTTEFLTQSSFWRANRPLKIKNGTIFFFVGKVKDKFAYFWIYGLLSPLETRVIY